jgi:hypothetical protein
MIDEWISAGQNQPETNKKAQKKVRWTVQGKKKKVK